MFDISIFRMEIIRNFYLKIFQISNRLETFQDLSLPIPSRDQLSVIHQSVQQTPSQGEEQVKQYDNNYFTLSWDNVLYRVGCLGCGVTFGAGFGDQAVVFKTVCLRSLVPMN